METTESKRSVSIELAVILLAFSAPALTSSVTHFIEPETYRSSLSVSSVVSAAGAAAVLVWLMWKKGWTRFGFISPTIVDLLGAAALVALYFFIGYLGHTAAIAPMNRNVAASYSFRMMFLPVLSVCYTAAGTFFEECLFRCYFVTRLEDLGAAPILAAVISSVVFGAGHLYQGIGGGLSAFAFGLVAVTAMYFRRSIAMLYLAHVVYDLLIFSSYIRH